MASKSKKGSVKKYCRISAWIEAHDSDLAAVIQDLCLGGRLAPSRGRGVTFIFPGKADREAIVAARDDAPETAIELVQSLIVSGCLKSGADFKGDVGSQLGVSLRAESVSGDTVTLPGGAKIEPAHDFAALPADKQIAVWVVKEGSVPHDESARSWAPKRGATGGRRAAHRHSRARHGGEASSAAASGSRAACAAKTAALYAAWAGGAAAQSEPDPYLVACARILARLRSGWEETWRAVLPVIDRDPLVCFYLLVEPHKTSGSYLIPDEACCAAGGDAPVGDAADEFEKNFREAGPYDPAAMNAARDDARTKTFGFQLEKVDVSAAAKVAAIYENLMARNSIDSLSGVLSEATRKLISAPQKLWQDEFRHRVHAQMSDLRRAPWDAHGFREIIQSLGCCPGNDYVGERILTNPETYQGSQDKSGYITALKDFIRSTHFLYLATPAEVNGSAEYWGGGEIPATDKPTRDYSEVYNAEASKIRYLGGMAGRTDPGLAQAVNAVNAYVEREGRNPPGLHCSCGRHEE